MAKQIFLMYIWPFPNIMYEEAKELILQKLNYMRQVPEIQMQSLGSVLQNKCSEKFRTIHRKHLCRSLFLIKLETSLGACEQDFLETLISCSAHLLVFANISYRRGKIKCDTSDI